MEDFKQVLIDNGYSEDDIEHILECEVSQEVWIGHIVGYLEEEFFALTSMFDCYVYDIMEVFYNNLIQRLSCMKPSWAASRYFMTGLDIISEGPINICALSHGNIYFIFDEDDPLFQTDLGNCFHDAGDTILNSSTIQKEIEKQLYETCSKCLEKDSKNIDNIAFHKMLYNQIYEKISN